jgi:hypothetical protein
LLSLPRLLNIIERVLKELRYKFGEVRIIRIKEYKSKYEIIMIVENNNVKVIIYKDRIKTRVYAGGLRGLEISLRRIFVREYEKELRLKKCEQEGSI